MEYIIGIIVVLLLVLLFANVRIVPQATEYVIEFLGKYKTTWGAGLHVKIPLIEKIAKKITLKELSYVKRAKISQAVYSPYRYFYLCTCSSYRAAAVRSIVVCGNHAPFPNLARYYNDYLLSLCALFRNFAFYAAQNIETDIVGRYIHKRKFA